MHAVPSCCLPTTTTPKTCPTPSPQAWTAYVVADLAADRVKPVLEVALAEFQLEEALRRELTDAPSQLSERKTIDRLKGLLMSRQSLSEEEVYAPLRKTTMDNGLKSAGAAQHILDVAALLA